VGLVAASGFPALVFADYGAFYHYRGESRPKLLALAPLRMLVNPSLHAALLIRLVAASPAPLTFIWRNILIAKHSIDVYRRPTIGPGLILAHPLGIVLGGGEIGSHVVLTHNVTIGAARTPRPGEELPFPIIGDRVVINPGSLVVGGVRIGADCVIGANSIVDFDMPPNSIYSRGRLRPRTQTGGHMDAITRA
jgi:serine acetyltransferase